MVFRDEKDQHLVRTPYGRGIVLRTRHNDQIKEIELIDWTEAKARGNRTKNPNMLFSPIEFPSVKPEIGSDVMTQFGRGKVSDFRKDNIVVVRISSWRLAGRSVVSCYLSLNKIKVVRPHRLHEMSVYEKIEHAQDLKEKASFKFSNKEYKQALQLYAEAVDAVRYVQHKSDSTNYVRADLLLVMITCCNNAATCSLFLSRFEDARKFAKNALILIDALYEKREKSKILELLYREGMKENKLFGVWKVKSLVLIARGLAESYESEDAISTLKKALDIVTTYKREGESTYQQFVSQEKQIRRLHKTCKQRIIAERKKEKQRAQAFFRSRGSKKPSKQENTSATTTQMLAETVQRKQVEENKEVPSSLSKARESSDRNRDEDLSVSQDSSKKRVTFEDRSKPGSNTNIEDDSSTFFEEHKEAMLLITGGVVGYILYSFVAKKRR